MKAETLSVSGFNPAIHAMRNPMNSWIRSDSNETGIGPNDRELSEKLQNAGPEHCKHLRMIIVWADITAPRYMLQELDTYRAGVEKVSTSTMHKLLARELTLDDFEYDEIAKPYLKQTIKQINNLMGVYKEYKADECELEAKEVWRAIIQLLPQSYLQKRTYMFSYAALRNIVRQRTGHKLSEWADFIAWCKTLPNAWMIFE